MAAASAVDWACRDSDSIMPSSNTMEMQMHSATISNATKGATAPLRRQVGFKVMTHSSGENNIPAS
jgi:hypothetical protein